MDSPNSVNLYEVVVPPSYQNLFFIGIVELPYAHPFSKYHSPKTFQDFLLTIHTSGPLPPISEIQARWAVGILSKKFSLPTPEQMTRSIEQFQLNLAKNVSLLISSLPSAPHPSHSLHNHTANISPSSPFLVRPLRPAHSIHRLPPLRRPPPFPPTRKPLFPPALPSTLHLASSPCI